MNRPVWPILFEDNHLLAIAKPAPLATMGALASQETLLDQAKLYLKHKYRKPGNVYLGVVSRLDAMVTGVVVFARTSKAAQRLSQQFRDRKTRKLYWALVPHPLQPHAGSCRDWLLKDDQKHRMRVVSSTTAGAQCAELGYRTCGTVGRYSWLEIDLLTGRKHQIRVQLAELGAPILGDRKYGSQARWPQGIALHSRELHLDHPVQHTPLHLIAPVPDSWRESGFRG